MKKQIIFLGVAATFAMTSCIDNEESETVLAMRAAKLSLLNAQVASANADADLDSAYSAYQSAMYEIELAKERADSEVDMIEAHNALQQARLDSAEAAATYEAELEMAVLKAELAIADELKSLSNELYYDVTDAANTYEVAVYSYYNAVTNLNSYNKKLAQLEADLIDSKEANEERIAELKNYITLAQYKIENYKKYANYKEGGAEELKAEYEELTSDINLAWDEYYTALKAYDAINDKSSLDGLKAKQVLEAANTELEILIAAREVVYDVLYDNYVYDSDNYEYFSGYQDGTQTIENSIDSLEEDIEDWEEEIAELEVEVADGGDTDTANSIEYYKLLISQQEITVATRKTRMEVALAAYNEAVEAYNASIAE